MYFTFVKALSNTKIQVPNDKMQVPNDKMQVPKYK